MVDQVNEIERNIKSYQDKVSKSESNLIQYEQKQKDYEIYKNKLEKEKIDLKQSHDKYNWQYNEAAENLNVNNVTSSTLKTQIVSHEETLSKLKANMSVLSIKKQDLLSDVKQPTKVEGKNKLNALIDKKRDKDNQLAKIQDKISSLDNDIRNIDEQLRELSLNMNELNSDINNNKIEITEIKTNKSSLFDNSDFNKEVILNAIKNIDETPLKDDEDALEETRVKIEKLGAINLAAIDELKENEERKSYLDRQFDDLTKSIDTLEAAIKKIDLETKTKFKETFDSINGNLEYFFPKIFGGGKAFLELTDNDLLNTGVNIMAKPPGKLVKNLNLLSGGEKAGTGIAFVFSIFKINPAPFCLLDEVDAPLDEANNERFCNVVKEMSESVQFIFITHNKSTMQIADVLSGVTMREAGVSKLVSVNVEDALELATQS